MLPGVSSNWKSINAGVPQGSILGPLLFLVYINDIVDDINSKIRLFADDTSLFVIVDNPVETAQMLDADMEKIHEMASKWLVTFNSSKSESLLLSRKPPYHPLVTMNGETISEIDSHKHLGIIFSKD